MKQNYGVLRIIRVRPPANAMTNSQIKYPTGWLPGEGLIHVLTRRETTIGRALDNDIFLMDPTASREHARLVLDAYGWHLINLTAQNIVCVNGRPVPSGESLPVQSQDIIILGSTMLQLIAPQNQQPASPDEPLNPHGASIEGGWSPQTLPFSAQTQPPDWQDGQQRQRVVSSLPVQPDAELEPQPWEDVETESWLSAGVTMQFAPPSKLSIRLRAHPGSQDEERCAGDAQQERQDQCHPGSSHRQAGQPSREFMGLLAVDNCHWWRSIRCQPYYPSGTDAQVVRDRRFGSIEAQVR